MPNQPSPEMTRPDAADESWTQRGAFSVFFDVTTGPEAGEVWRTRIYHEETGDEHVITGPDPVGWYRWILARLGAAASETVDRGPVLVSVDVVEVHLLGRETAGSGAEVLRIESTLRIDGLAELERALGAALVQRGLGR